MSSNQYNLIVFSNDVSGFLQDIDDSNVVNGQIVYYLNSRYNIVIDPANYPKLGFLALVNCSHVTIRDLDIRSNGDGLLLAYSGSCTLTNTTLGENSGPLVYGGLTFYNSNSTTVVNSIIYNNSYALCLHECYNTVFYHNNLLNNRKNVVADYIAPFTNASSTIFSTSIWDNGLEGNFWSDYTGHDENSDGIGEQYYGVVSGPAVPPDAIQNDHYPLLGPFHSYRVIYANLSRNSDVGLVSNSSVSNFTVADSNSQTGSIVVVFNVEGGSGLGFCRICIPYELITPTYSIVIDKGETMVLFVNDTVYENGTHRWLYFTYPSEKHQIEIASEPQSGFIVSAIFTLFTVLAKKRKFP